MQPVTVAISPTGIQYLLKSLLGDRIAQALESNLGAPGYSFQPGPFQFLPGGEAIENDYSNISINISGGRIQSLSPVFSGCVQGPDGDNSQFAITMTVSNLAVDYPGGWDESYDYQAYTWIRGGVKGKAYSDQNGHHNNTYDYSVELPTLTIQVTFQLAASSGVYELTYVNGSGSGSGSAGNPQPNIPGGSILNQQQSETCGYSSHIAAATKQQIGNMNWSGALASALNPIFASIGESGRLGPVTFDFLDPSDTPPAFPSGGGIQIGAKGLVSANGSAYPVPPPADLPFPPVPTGNPAPHVTYFIQDYEVNALFWGFQAAGVLKTTLASGNLADPQALETNTYAGGSLKELAAKYPGLLMTADLAAREAPTVAFQTVYEFNAKNLQDIQEALGATSWGQFGNEINELNGSAFSSQSGLEMELSQIDSALSTFAATIEKCTGLSGVVVTHTTRCVLNVLDKGNTIPVITFDVAQTFLMDGLQLGQSSSGTGKVQSVIFTFEQPMDALPQASFISSIIPGVDGGDFGDVWSALRPNWQDVFAEVGKAGMPLPRIPGFDFLFQQAQVDVNAATSTADGYLSITANVTYSPENLTAAVRQLIGNRATPR